MLWLNEDEVGELFSTSDALQAVELALRAQATGDATNEPRRRVRANGAILMTMSGAIASQGVFGFKAYSVARGKARFHVNLYDTATGELLAIMEADRLGQMRTGAASGIASKYLAREDATSVGIYGTGWQAQSQLASVCAVRKINSVRVFSRSEEKRNSFCEVMAARLGIRDISPVGEAEAAADSDILITITNSREPVLKGTWLRDGVHINAAGGNSILRIIHYPPIGADQIPGSVRAELPHYDPPALGAPVMEKSRHAYGIQTSWVPEHVDSPTL